MKTVLIVDDVRFVRKTLSDILTRAHYQVVGEAENGTKAVELFRKLKPDIVTMDVVMPDQSGIEATRQILKIEKDAVVIMISAIGQEGLVMEAVNAGARDYVLKPFSEPDIIKTIEHALTGGDSANARAGGRVQAG